MDTLSTATAVLAQLERVLASEAFANASRSGKLLRFLVEQTVSGQAERAWWERGVNLRPR